MSDRKLLGLFSGTHLTLIIMTAIAAPTALWGAATASQVIITDANQHLAQITGGKLQVYNPVADPLSGYSQDPRNSVDTEIPLNSSMSGCVGAVYTPPQGKALVLTAVTGFDAIPTSGSGAGFYLERDSNCINDATGFYFNNTSGYAPIAQNFGTGIVFSGTIYVFNTGIGGYVFLHGYLVPLTAVATTTTAAPQARNYRDPKTKT